MLSNETKPGILQQQLSVLSNQAGTVRDALANQGANLPPASLDGLKQLETTLSELSKKMGIFEAAHNNLLALAGIGQVVNSTLELDAVLQIVMDTIVRLTRAERGFLMLRDDRNELTTRIARNWEQESIHPNEFAISRTIMQKVIDTGEPVLTTNAQEDPRFGSQESVVAYSLRSILCVPLKVKNELIGLIYADNRIRSGIFSENARDLLTAFANQAAVAIDNARLFSSLKHTLGEVTELKSLMDNIFASIASGVITADVQGQITLCNRAAENILGFTAADLIGHPLNEVLPDVAEDLTHHLASVRNSDQPIVGLELNHKMPTRGLVDWRLNLSPLKDADKTTQGVAIVLDDMTEHKRLEAQRRLFERMVSPAVINQLNPDSLQLGGKHVDLTVLFADIRGFTTYSERISPEQLVSVLNRYLAAMAEAVLAQEGTIDKFLGDAIMAWFNAPILQPDHTLRAVKAALLMRERVETLYQELPSDSHLAFGVGIHYGDAVLGLIGTERRLEYTAISDSVNTAKRIQENSARNQILISKEAYERVKNDLEVKYVAPMAVKGKSQPVEVYEVLELKNAGGR
jgi:PAS domain S-box-containing protein